MDIVNWHKRNDMLGFKIGDYVRVRRDLDPKKTYGVPVGPNMLCFRDAVSRISKVRENGVYELLGMVNAGHYIWSKDILQRVPKEDIAQNKMFLACDTVRIIPNFSEIARENNDIDPEEVGRMDEYAGLSTFITDILFCGGKIESYELNADNGDHWWPPQYIQRITKKQWLESKDVTMAPGTLVKVREDLSSNKYYGSLPVHEEMVKFAGMKIFIDDVDIDDTYHLAGTDNEDMIFWWTPEMLELVE